eukprot:COSAG02_NODE_2299_length_9190_cov_122.517655_12_plen_147_part_00
MSPLVSRCSFGKACKLRCDREYARNRSPREGTSPTQTASSSSSSRGAEIQLQMALSVHPITTEIACSNDHNFDLPTEPPDHWLTGYTLNHGVVLSLLFTCRGSLGRKRAMMKRKQLQKKILPDSQTYCLSARQLLSSFELMLQYMR